MFDVFFGALFCAELELCFGSVAAAGVARTELECCDGSWPSAPSFWVLIYFLNTDTVVNCIWLKTGNFPYYSTTR